MNEILWVAPVGDPPPPEDDTFPPDVVITSPNDGDVFEPGSIFTVLAEASDNVGVSSVVFRLNGVTQCIETESPYSCHVSIDDTPDASHLIAAEAFDAAGNSASDSITVFSSGPDTEPPTVAITSPGDGAVFAPGSAFTVQADASDNFGVSQVVFRLNGVDQCVDADAPYSCQITIDDTPDASHQVTAQAFDAAGNSASHSITIFSSSGPDTEPPTVAITSPGDGAVFAPGSTFTVQADASDNFGVSQVVFRLNGVDQCVDADAPYSCQITIDDTPEASHQVTAQAFDAAGNSASHSITVFSDAGPDSEPPTVAITSPNDGDLIQIESTFSVQADASDNVGVTQVVFRLDGVDQCIDTLAPYSCQMTIGRRANINYQITAQAFDAAGNSASHSITITSFADTEPPTVAITSPGDGAVFAPGSTFTVQADAADNVGVSSVVFRLNGVTKCQDTEAPYSCQMTIDDTPDASHQISAHAFDAAGNSASHSITVFSSSEPDTEPPTVAITSPADGAVFAPGSTFTVQADAADNFGVAQVIFRLNGVDQCLDADAPYSCQITIDDTPEASHQISAHAFDAAGNSASHSITVFSSSEPDTEPPTVAIISPGDGAIVPRRSTVTVQADASDNVGVTQVVFRLDGVDQCLDVQAPYTCDIWIPSKPSITYVITAEAFDAAGNSSSDSITVTSSGSSP